MTFRRSTLAALILLIGIAAASLSCGYRVRNSAGSLPGGMLSLGIPTFRNQTNEFKIEQIITGALLQEFRLRTKGSVDSRSSDVDLVLLGEIQSMDSVPVTFRTQSSGAQTFGSTFQVTVHASAKLVRLRDSAVIWKNENFVFRERYVLNVSVRDFFSEENPALERLARSFAASLASTILDRQKP